MFLEHASYRYPTHLVPLLDLLLTLLLLALFLWLRRRAGGRVPERPIGAWHRAIGHRAINLCHGAWHRLRRASRHRAGLLWGLFLFGVLASAAVELVLGPPVPRVVDELSYLHAAETFADGRLTNPPSPHPRHFEVIHVLPGPTMQSKYPPAQALVLALGVALGRPSASLWLLTGLLGVAVAWVLRQWLAPPWPLLGAVFAVLRVGLGSYWNQSYWGGTVAMIAGLLVLGGVRRTMIRSSPADAALAGLGLVVLATSRPFEGLLFSLPFGVLLLVWLFGPADGAQWRRRVRSTLPLVGVLAAGALALGTYHRAVTGSALAFPHLVYTERYLPEGVVHFLWNHPFDVPWWWVALDRGLPRLAYVGFFYAGLAGSCLAVLAFVAGQGSRPVVRRDRWLLAGCAGAALVLAGQFLTKPWHLHYSAPLGGVVVLLTILGLRRLTLGLEADRRPGRALALAFVAAQLVLCLAQLPAHRPDDGSTAALRETTRAWLASQPGRDLVFLCSSWGRDEWMLNPPDPGTAEVLWVRELAPAENEALRRAFPQRRVWHLERTRDGVVLRRGVHDGEPAFSLPADQSSPGGAGSSTSSTSADGPSGTVSTNSPGAKPSRVARSV